MSCSLPSSSKLSVGCIWRAPPFRHPYSNYLTGDLCKPVGLFRVPYLLNWGTGALKNTSHVCTWELLLRQVYLVCGWLGIPKPAKDKKRGFPPPFLIFSVLRAQIKRIGWSLCLATDFLPVGEQLPKFDDALVPPIKLGFTIAY